MKKLLFILAAVISLVAYSINAYADGAVKIYKNGNFITYYANEVDSVVFFNDNENSNDTIESSVDEALLIGSWESDLTMCEAYVTEGGVRQQIPISDFADGVDGALQSRLFFYADHTWVGYEWDFTKNQYVEIDLELNGYHTWSLNGNTLTVAHHDEEGAGSYEADEITIIKITENQLTLLQEESFGPNDKYELYMTFKRIKTR